MNRAAQADVIVVGGGIMGSAATFFLRRRGRSVILLERGLVGQQASGTNFGNVRRQGRFLPQLPLANRSRAIWGRLGELLGEDAEFLVSGHVRVCYSHEQIAAFEAHAREARHYGLELEILTGNALRDRFPLIGPEAVGGSFSPHDGHANPRLAAPAFAYAARREGADVRENIEVLSIAKSGDDFVVDAEGGASFRAPIVLITAGAWGGALAAAFGEPVPLVARGPQMAVTEPVPYAITPVVGVSSKIAEEGIYLRQIPRGNVIFGGGSRGPAFTDIRRAYVMPRNTLGQLTQIRRVIPALNALRIIRVWSGIESYLPDDIPIMGPSARVSGLFYAFGFCGHGFQLGPGVGDVMAELIDTGATSTPIDPFHIRRFARTVEPS
ncbi:MAG: FAD-binding oxidoreductase [Alphaproteobacteria bacterium]|nr:FAD-binding oxidoreductase [Alphaproteobacteria bacterium]